MAATARDLVDDVGVYIPCFLSRRVKLPSRLQNKHYRESIIDILKSGVEGVCGADGFVRPNSIQIKTISPGRLDMSSLSGVATYDVLFSADLCNPAVGDILTCRVENVNTYGVLAVNLSETRVLEVILPRQPVSFEHSIPLDDMEPGDTLSLEVLGRQFKLGQRTITLVGKAVSKDHKAVRSNVAERPLQDAEDDGSEAGSESQADMLDGALDDVDSDADTDAEKDDPDADIDEDDASDAEESLHDDDHGSVHDQDDDLEMELDDGMLSD